MPFFFKPVVWNSNGYRGPSGGKFTSGFPKDHGYGHEEWNNAPARNYQPHVTVLRPGAVSDPDLSKLGEALRAHVPAIAFDRFVIRNRVR